MNFFTAIQLSLCPITYRRRPRKCKRYKQQLLRRMIQELSSEAKPINFTENLILNHSFG